MRIGDDQWKRELALVVVIAVIVGLCLFAWMMRMAGLG